MRWYTCTPVAFGGGPDFFARDSGLLCRGFQELGIESRAVMPGVACEGDGPDLIRTAYANLESVEWWDAQGVDGVVLYAWGRPKFRKVAAAIKKAGIRLVLNQDNGGLVSPLAGLRPWLREQWILTGQGRGAGAVWRFVKLVVRGLSVGLCLTDPLRASHLRSGDLITCVSPRAAEHYVKLCRHYGGESLASRVAMIPHAVEPRFDDAGGVKRRQVACVGRWDDMVQKRPGLLVSVMAALLEQDAEVTVVIAGARTPLLEEWHQQLPVGQQNRVTLAGRASRDELLAIYQASRVFYSPSAFESFGIAAAEALCAGCSVVAAKSVSMAAFEWFVNASSGTLALRDESTAHAAALIRELECWDQGERSAAQIAATWQPRLHAPAVARRVLELAALPCADGMLQMPQ